MTLHSLYYAENLKQHFSENSIKIGAVFLSLLQTQMNMLLRLRFIHDAFLYFLQVSGQTAQALYSCLDELPSLDGELYRSLSYIKHYEGDVSELDLTFSVDDDNLGRLVTHELVPGGKAVPVTNENKYVIEALVQLLFSENMCGQKNSTSQIFLRTFFF